MGRALSGQRSRSVRSNMRHCCTRPRPCADTLIRRCSPTMIFLPLLSYTVLACSWWMMSEMLPRCPMCCAMSAVVICICMYVVRSLCIYHSYLTLFLDRRLVSPPFSCARLPAQSIAYPEIPGMLTWCCKPGRGRIMSGLRSFLFGDVVQPTIRRQLRQLF